MKTHILDSWAVMAFFKKEAAHLKIKTILDTAASGKLRLIMSVINLAEVYYKLYRRVGKLEAQKSIASLMRVPIEIIPASDSLIFEAAEIKAVYPIAFGDCFAAAVAKREKGAILTGDPEFRKLKMIVKIEWL